MMKYPTKTIKIWLFLIVLFINAFIAIGITGTTNSFYGQGNPFEITLHNYSNYTYWLNIPRYSYINTVNFTVFSSGSLGNCTQEFANISTCGYQKLGNYSFSETSYSCSNGAGAMDGDYTTYAARDGLTTCRIMINYSLPYNKSQNFIWRVQDDELVNLTINKTMYNASEGKVRFIAQNIGDTATTYWYIINASNETQILRMHSGGIFEEAAIWNLTFLENMTISLSDKVQYKSNLTTDINNVSINNSLINSILSSGCTCTNCSISGDDCLIPFIFHSDTSGILSVNLSNATYYQDIDNCTLYNQTVLNVSYFDAITNSPLQVDETGYVWYITDGYFSYTLNANPHDAYSHSLCTSLNTSYINHSWSLYGQIISAKKSDYVTVSYDIPSTIPITISNFAPYNLSIYLINISDSTTVKYSWQTSAYIAVSGNIYIYECNPDNTRSLILITPIINGDAYANIELLNQPYSYSVLYNNIFYQNNDTYSKCHTESASTLSFFIDTEVVNVVQPVGMYSIQCNVTKTSNTTVRVSWSNNPYSTLPITGCIYAYRNGVTGAIQTYVNCTNSSNFIERTVPNTGYGYIINGKLFQGGYSIICSQSQSFYMNVQPARTFGLMGLFSVIFLIVAMTLFWAGDDTKQSIGAMIGIVCSWLLGLVAFDWRLISSMCSFLLIIMWVGRSASKR